MPSKMRNFMDICESIEVKNEDVRIEQDIININILGDGFKNKGSVLGNDKKIQIQYDITITGLPPEIISEVNKNISFDDFVKLLKEKDYI